MRPSGAHTHPDGGGGALVAIVAVVIIGAIIAKPVLHAADVLLHIVFITLAILAGLAVAGIGTGLLIRRRYVTRQPPWQVTVEPLTARPVQARTEPRELPAPPRQVHVHFHGIDPAEVAAIIRQQQDSIEEKS